MAAQYRGKRRNGRIEKGIGASQGGVLQEGCKGGARAKQAARCADPEDVGGVNWSGSGWISRANSNPVSADRNFLTRVRLQRWNDILHHSSLQSILRDVVYERSVKHKLGTLFPVIKDKTLIRYV
jgi:hypothetical protein